MDPELRDLLAKAQEGRLSPGGLERLEQRLLGSKADRTDTLRFQQLLALLESDPPPVEVRKLEEHRDRSGQVNSLRHGMVFAIAASVALLLLLISNLRPASSGVGSLPGGSQVATLLLDETGQWRNLTPSEGERLARGRIALATGTAVIRFDGGAEMILTGPAEVDLTSPMSASLVSGEVVVRAEEGAEGFSLDTPSAELIDLGTEFAVRIDRDGDTELHVHEGEVAVGKAASPPVVTQGHAVRLRKGGEEPFSELKLDAPRFHELLARAAPKERRDLMTAYEGFHHLDEGSYRPKQLDGGKGWAGPWRLRRPDEFGNSTEDSSRDMTIAFSRMEIAWPIKGGQLGMLEMPSGQNVRIRKLEDPVRLGSWGHRYLSFLVTETTGRPGSTENGRVGRSDIRITLRSAKDYFGESISLGWERSRRPRVSAGNGTTVRSPRTIPEGETIFCVAKITSREQGRDEIRFRFYTREDHLDLLEPAEWDVVLTDVKMDSELDLLLLTSHSHQKRYVDEIRMGPTWRSVTPVYLSRELEEMDVSGLPVR